MLTFKTGQLLKNLENYSQFKVAEVTINFNPPFLLITAYFTNANNTSVYKLRS